MKSIADDYYDQESVASSSSYQHTGHSLSSVSTFNPIYDEKEELIKEHTDCKEKNTYRKQNWVNPDVIRDIIIGLSDGLTVPFGLTAGLSGLDNSKIVVVGGMAELVSGAISMGMGGMLSAQAELDHYRYTQKQIAERVSKSTSTSIHREISSIFEPLGLSSDTSSRITSELQQIEEEDKKEHSAPFFTLPSPCNARSYIRNPSRASFVPTRGLTPLLMRMGEGLEDLDESRVWQSALTIGLSYFFGGFIPLMPYLFYTSVSRAFFASIMMTAGTLIVFGVIKQKCTGLGDARSLMKSALSTLAVGGAAAGSSWMIVRSLENK